MVYIILYILGCIATSIFLVKVDWIYGLYDFGDYIFTGFVSVFFPIFLPILLIGLIGVKVNEYFERLC